MAMVLVTVLATAPTMAQHTPSMAHRMQMVLTATRRIAIQLKLVMEHTVEMVLAIATTTATAQTMAQSIAIPQIILRFLINAQVAALLPISPLFKITPRQVAT